MIRNDFAGRRTPGTVVFESLVILLLGALLFSAAQSAQAQVSPSEILNPQLQQLEKTYLPQLQALNHFITSAKFPFSFVLSRYVGLDPSQQSGTDTRGIEFVRFKGRVVLKITGNYNAAYNADQLTQNERAARVFSEVFVPILAGVNQEIPGDVACDAIGFEISYHVRRAVKSYNFEGKELLVAVFDPADAFGFLKTSDEKARQAILNRSEVYLDGKEFGLALGARDPLDAEQLKGADTGQPAAPSVSTTEHPNANTRSASVNPRLLPTFSSPATPATPSSPSAPNLSYGSTAPQRAERMENTAPPSAANSAVVEQLQTRYQKELDALAKDGQGKFHFVDYAPPSFVLFQNRVLLQLTLRNTNPFDSETTSIYKRAAQTFDLFLAPQLKGMLDKIPSGADFDGLDISVLNTLKSSPSASSEALEFVCPLKPLRQFVDAEITNQELINQSVVLVNGVRIALNLQLVE
jgi:hypothetical protein